MGCGFLLFHFDHLEIFDLPWLVDTEDLIGLIVIHVSKYSTVISSCKSSDNQVYDFRFTDTVFSMSLVKLTVRKIDS